jgi:hypothetical protein
MGQSLIEVVKKVRRRNTPYLVRTWRVGSSGGAGSVLPPVRVENVRRLLAAHRCAAIDCGAGDPFCTDLLYPCQLRVVDIIPQPRSTSICRCFRFLQCTAFDANLSVYRWRILCYFLMRFESIVKYT